MTTILLDIDGVLLPTRDRDPWGHFQVADWQGKRRKIDEQMRSRLVRLFHLGNVLWYSSWQERSSLLARALIVPERPFLPFEIKKSRWSEGSAEWSWKLHSLSEWDQGQSPLIWIDDDIKESI